MLVGFFGRCSPCIAAGPRTGAADREGPDVAPDSGEADKRSLLAGEALKLDGEWGARQGTKGKASLVASLAGAEAQRWDTERQVPG